jgi:G-protein coupled receptor 98
VTVHSLRHCISYFVTAFTWVYSVDRAFQDVQVSWRVTFNKTAPVLQKEEVNLMDELLSVSGITTCAVGQTQCLITLELKPEKVRNDEA